MQRRIASLWFPRLASERHLRLRPQPDGGAFALTIRQNNAERIYCANGVAELEGVAPGMAASDARAVCPGLATAWADPQMDGRFLTRLARWAERYCPWVGVDGGDGLVLDISGSAHLFGGEAALADTMRQALARAGMTAKLGIAETRGAAWALARFGPESWGGIAPPAQVWAALKDLPAAGLRLEPRALIGLERLGVRTIAQLADLPRSTVTKRFGRGPVMRLDQALGNRAEEVSPLAPPPVFAATLGLPDPIGLADDVMAALDRLLEQVCHRLAGAERGARVVQLTLHRVDRASRQIELRLARPMRDTARMRALFEPHIQKIDAGFGIERLRLEAVETEALPAQQISHHAAAQQDKLADLITRLGNRIGLERITRFVPADSHLPERSVAQVPAAYSEAASWHAGRVRPVLLFPPEPVVIRGGPGSAEPPGRFRWRSMQLSTARAVGPERIAPSWWQDDPAWTSGLRDYWRVETREGRRIWMFRTPQNPGWYVQGEFP